jgi:glutaredoxin
MIRIDVFCAPNCNRCNNAIDLVKTIANEDPKKFQYRKIDVVEEIDYAVSLGIRATPSIAINGTLIFTSCPDSVTLKKHLFSLTENSHTNE